MLPFSVIRIHWRLLGFGFAMAFFSSFGQTFFISLFSGELRDAFSLSHGEFGSIYAFATLSSAAILVFAGRLIDRWSLVAFSCAALLGLAAAGAAMGFVGSAITLTFCLFGLRLFGQGLTSHASITTMARYFEAERGRTLALASLGHAGGEAFLPPLIVASLTITTWQNLWFGAALFLVLVAAPLILWLLRGHHIRQAQFATGGTRERQTDSTLGAALRDPGLYLRLPALLCTSSIGTGLVFHQVHIATTKGWPLALMAGSFSLYAAGAVVMSIVSGILVDKTSARRLVSFFLIPLILTCIVTAEVDAFWGAPLLFAFLGIAAGFNASVQGAIWAELYGITHLGSIRAFAQSAMVFSTGVAPAAMGLLIDAGLSIAAIAWGSAIISAAASALARLATDRRESIAE